MSEMPTGTGERAADQPSLTPQTEPVAAGAEHSSSPSAAGGRPTGEHSEAHSSTRPHGGHHDQPREGTPRPYWLPHDFDVEALPHELRAAFDALIQPAYCELVLAEPDRLRALAGDTFVHLAFLELLERFGMSQDLAGRLARSETSRAVREAEFKRLLRAIGAKESACKLLLRLRQLRPEDPMRGPNRPGAHFGNPPIG
jgi:hypothetical protein